ncbi:hypothetical protein F0357_04660 [Rhizobiales bacterium Sp-1]|uniref:Uncharacterized protein n=1 Tax=Segnochrobactrum spirostomi TaxID=2608987 RepID=A0A6A7Y1I2_9HYPH|nr:hypothetical protein [Segnochrobactrum spirostomi]
MVMPIAAASGRQNTETPSAVPIETRNGERRGWHQPAIEARPRDDALAAEKPGLRRRRTGGDLVQSNHDVPPTRASARPARPVCAES